MTKLFPNYAAVAPHAMPMNLPMKPDVSRFTVTSFSDACPCEASPRFSSFRRPFHSRTISGEKEIPDYRTMIWSTRQQPPLVLSRAILSTRQLSRSLIFVDSPEASETRRDYSIRPIRARALVFVHANHDIANDSLGSSLPATENSLSLSVFRDSWKAARG